MSNDIIIDKIMPRTRYIADGTNLEFPFLFSVFSAEDLNVYLDDTLLKSSVYTVLINNDGNGNVIFDTAPAEGKIITIIRNLDIKRTSDFQESGAFRAKAINHELDYQVACIQQIEERLDRSIIMPPYNATNAKLEIPKPQKGRALVWNEDGTNFKNSDLEIDTAFISIANVVPKAEQVAADAAEVREKTQNMLDIINAKAETNAGNFTPEGQANIINMLLPDWSAKVTHELGETWIAPSAGWLFITVQTNSDSDVYLKYNDKFFCNLGINEEEGRIGTSVTATRNRNTITMPISVDDKIYIYHKKSGVNADLYLFLPCKGVA